MSFGVDVLGTLTEKLRHMFDETQGKYSTFANANKLYKEHTLSEKKFFLQITDYMVNLSALNFLAVRVVLELKSAMEKGTSIKDTTGGLVSTDASQKSSFGLEGFIGTGGRVGVSDTQEQSQVPSFRPVDIEIKKHRPEIQEHESIQDPDKRCAICGANISKEAKFCSKCGNLLK